MSVPAFELRQLEYFTMLAEDLHFSRAAQRVYISQSALSQQIGRLESTVGVRLFERDKHSVQLTPAGRVFLEGATKTLAAARQAARDLAEFCTDPAAGRLRVGYREYGFSAVVLPAFTRVLAAHPRARLERVDLGIGQLIPSLLEGSIDLGIGLLPLSHPKIESERVASGHWVAVLPRAHKLARKRVLRPRDLASERIILFQRGLNPAIYDGLVKGLRGAGAPVEIVYETAQVQLGPALAGEGMGIFLVASYALPPVDRSVTVRRLEGLGKALEVGACWRAGESNALLDEFRRAMRLQSNEIRHN
jgi:DNA-binding transcriptional LysR family regulator